MSDIALVVGAYPRVLFACRNRGVRHEGAQRLTEHQIRILSHLDAEDPVMVTELAEYMGVTASTMSLNLKRLEGTGFVARSRDPDDGRVTNVRLTEAGARVRDSTTLLDPERVAALLGALSPDDRRRAVRGLALLADAADGLVSGRGATPEPPRSEDR